ncbi:MAG: pyridoxal-phosphate dependent enzyme [Polyangiaceae bacterium]
MTFDTIARLGLAHTPTPLWRHPALDALVGTEVWVKRDDMSSGAAAGNKIRKLEYLLAAARDARADVVLTCGGAQSNHARATALLARGLGMDAVLLLRSDDPANEPVVGNLFLDRLTGAEVRWVSRAEYAERDARLARAADDLRAAGRTPYVIPEGGSNALGALGYVHAMSELKQQLELGLAGGAPFDAVVHACGSGGTAAGCALGASAFGVAARVIAIAVCDDRDYFAARIAGVITDMRSLCAGLPPPVPVDVQDAFKGPAYGVASDEQLDFIVRVARETGLVLDPVYSGKALFGLARLVGENPSERPRRVLFIHTGGLPGLLAQASTLLTRA